MEIAFYDWAAMLLRWVHVITALVWIGASFYLISWENKFNRLHGLRDGVEGDFWTIQGGDFYFVEKLKSAPAKLPGELHWFKYEAYFTWLSGFALMCVFYYSSPAIMLLDPSSPFTSPAQAVVASAGSLVTVWLVYSLYSRTTAARNLRLSAIVGVLGVALLAWVYGYLFNGRAAVIHVAAALGTIMSANVFFSIIPWHKRLIRAIKASEPADEIYRSHPGFRSRHNHYLTLPVLFLMLSAHAPVNFDGDMSWLVVTLLATSMGLLKHFHTCIQKKAGSVGYLLAGLLVFFVAMLVAASDSSSIISCEESIPTTTAEQIVSRRCMTCHRVNGGGPLAGDQSSIPAWESPGELLQMRAQVMEQVVSLQAMPPGNITGMTGHERRQLACWLSIESGSD